MIKPEAVALFDMDGTLADYETTLNKDLANLGGLSDTDYYIENRTRLIKSQPGWWTNLPPLKDGFDIYNLAKGIGYNITILTKGPKFTPAAWTEKFVWCQQHVPDADVSIVQDKGLVYGKVLVDDYPDYMLRWLKWRPRGLGIMPVRKINEGFTHLNVIKYDGTQDSLSKVALALVETFNRSQKE